MTKTELIDWLNTFYIETGVGIVVYALMKNDAIKKLDIQNDALPEMKAMFLDYISDHVVKNEDLEVLKLSSADDRRNALYEYDLDIPVELLSLKIITGNQADALPVFNMNTDKISNVKALLIEIGNNVQQIVLYKAMPPINIYESGKFFLSKSNTRFVKVEEDFFRVSPNFQLMSAGDSLFVLDLQSLERMFGFHEVIKKEAALGLNAIKASSLLENPEVLLDLLDDISFARKLTKIAKNSPVLLSGIDNHKIIQFCKVYPSLSGKIRFNSNEDKILLDTKRSKTLFIKLLMDDFLTSELTSYHYVSVAKDGIEESNTTPVEAK